MIEQTGVWLIAEQISVECMVEQVLVLSLQKAETYMVRRLERYVTIELESLEI